MRQPIFHLIKSLLKFTVVLLTISSSKCATVQSNTLSSSTSSQNSAISLTSRTFDSSIGDGNIWLVEFYAPWCSHCVRFSPTYEKIAQKFHSRHDELSRSEYRKVMVAKVDGANERALASRFSIKGFPSFFLVDGWEVRQYEGMRSMDALVKFANETYVDVDPIPFLNSPFGPIGQSRALLMHVGTKTIDLHGWLILKGLSHYSAAALLAFSGIMTSLTLIIIIGILLVPKEKSD